MSVLAWFVYLLLVLDTSCMFVQLVLVIGKPVVSGMDSMLNIQDIDFDINLIVEQYWLE